MAMVFESIAVARPKSARQALPDRVTRTLTSELHEPRSSDIKESGAHSFQIAVDNTRRKIV